MKPWEKYKQAEDGEKGPWLKYREQEMEQQPESQGYTPSDSGGFIETSVQGMPDNLGDIDLRGGAAALYRPMLEAGGAVAAERVASAPSGGVPTPFSVLMGGLGFAAGKNASDRLDELIGIQEPKPLSQILAETPSDLATGMTYEMAGPVITKPLSAVAKAARSEESKIVRPIFQAVKKAGKWVFEKSGAEGAYRAATQSGAEKAAKDILVASTDDGYLYAQNAAEAKQLEKEIPGLKFSLGQRTNDGGIIMLERSQIRPDGSAINISREMIANNTEAIRNYIKKNFDSGASIDDVQKLMADNRKSLESRLADAEIGLDANVNRMSPKQPQDTGKDIIGTIKEAEAPIKREMGKMGEKIPDYPMEFRNLEAKIKELSKDVKLSDDQVNALSQIKSSIEERIKRSKSTFSAMGIRRTINNAASKYYRAGENWSGKLMDDLKTALDDDLAEVSRLAEAGKVAEYQGRVVNPNELARQLEDDYTKLARLSTEQKPDLQLMQKELNDGGFPTMQVKGESAESFNDRIAKTYERVLNKEVPMTSDKTYQKTIEELESRIASNKDILAKASPGQDVAASMRAYNEFASTEYFNRFDKGAVKMAKARGNQSSGTRARVEEIPSYFATPSGADDLINAVGQEKAAGIMKGHYAFKMMNDVVDPSTGLIVPKKMSKWYKQNYQTLNKYGIDELFSSVESAGKWVDEARTELNNFNKSVAAKVLDADPEKAIANAIKGNNTGSAAKALIDACGDNKQAKEGLKRAFVDHIISTAETTAKDIKNNPKVGIATFSRQIKKYRPAMRELFKDEPEKIKAIENIQRSFEIMSRNVASPAGAGSDTSELVGQLMKKLFTASSKMTNKVGIAQAVMQFFGSIGNKNTNKALNRLLFDPDAAGAMETILKGNVDPSNISTVLNNKIVNFSDYVSSKSARAATAAGIMATSGRDRDNN